MDLSLDNLPRMARKSLMAVVFFAPRRVAENFGSAVNKSGKIRDSVVRSLITVT